MKKICIFFILLSFVCITTSACAPHKQKQNMIQSQRRFAKYIEPQAAQTKSVSIDLSEGPKLDYRRNLGPQDINFDIKIVDPYSY